MNLMTCKKILTVLFLVIAAAFSASAGDGIVYRNASFLPLYGKAAENTPGLYDRLPAELEGKVREPLWYLGQNSSGLYVRFRTDSRIIRVRWTSSFCNNMTHMTPVGTRGLDLYALTDSGWRFAGSARPSDKTTETSVVSGMDGREREYMLYLSLYDGVESLEIGVEEGCELLPPAVQSPKSDAPIVAYGTSILQGGCANRPGMAHTAILSRETDREVINLGFSGNALLDLEIAGLMASVENPALFIFDYVPNADVRLIDSTGETFFRIVRDAHPDVPVIFIEDPLFPHSEFDGGIAGEIAAKNKAQKALFMRLEKSGEKNIYYIAADGMIGDDGEATVDGIHFTDLGMVRYVDHILPVVRKALKNR